MVIASWKLFLEFEFMTSESQRSNAVSVYSYFKTHPNKNKTLSSAVVIKENTVILL